MMFRLALALGKTVREIEQGMDSRELSEWFAYTNLEPLPDAWQIGAMQCALTANCWSSGKKKYKVEDFMPREKKAPRQNPKQIGAALEMFAKQHNAKIASGTKPDQGEKLA